MRSMKQGGRGSLVVAAVLLVAAGCGTGSASSGSASTTTSERSTASGHQHAVTDLVLDPNHDYGNRYADGILPVGDGKVVLDGPQQGSIYLCHEGGDGGGADVRGPWFINDDTEYDINQKIHVEGEVDWDGTYSMTIDGDARSITTNAVPKDHPTGVFPVSQDDPAYQYDRNPNQITEQNLTYALPAEPQIEDQPQCMGPGAIGVLNSGVALFNGFDAGNRDAGAWEIQDGCDGHPERTGEYHYHTLSSCIDDASVDKVLGFALDGFPITGPRLSDENILTTGDLDECHGITSTINLDGKSVKTYHYVMTQDFPYSLSCYRGTPAAAPALGRG